MSKIRSNMETDLIEAYGPSVPKTKGTFFERNRALLPSVSHVSLPTTPLVTLSDCRATLVAKSDRFVE